MTGRVGSALRIYYFLTDFFLVRVGSGQRFDGSGLVHEKWPVDNSEPTTGGRTSFQGIRSMATDGSLGLLALCSSTAADEAGQKQKQSIMSLAMTLSIAFVFVLPFWVCIYECMNIQALDTIAIIFELEEECGWIDSILAVFYCR